MRTSYSTASDCAHSGELQHGVVPYSTRATHMPQQGTHGAVRTPRSYNTAQYSALRGTYQHGAHCAHSAHGAGCTQGSYSTARCSTARELLTCHSTARTAQCAPRGATTRRSAPTDDAHSTAHTAHMAQGAHRGATARLGAHRQKANARARQSTAEHKATRARSEHTRVRGAQGAPA